MKDNGLNDYYGISYSIFDIAKLYTQQSGKIANLILQ